MVEVVRASEVIDDVFNLYRKLGFNVVGEIDDNALQMYRMRKLLTVNRED
ncbi:hypothetical protein [Macrococcus armenti]|nr:hypothetical protein [Macrococcus armenti]UBH13713.1 hypothetical protein LAU43_03210 [Macrococcus armenti]